MKSSARGLVLLWIIIVVAALISISSFYYYKSSAEKTRKENERQVLIKKIADAKEKAKVESAKLKQLQDTFLGANPQNAVAQFAFPIADSLIHEQADKLFNNPNSANPDLKVNAKSKSIEAKIEAEREKINILLEVWKEKANKALSVVMSPQEIIQMKKEAEAIQQFISDLSAVVNALTPTNSGLPQNQIDDYKDAVEEAAQKAQDIVDAINEVLPPTTPVPSVAPSVAPTPPVTPQDIQNQQAIVDQTTTEVTHLEEELAALPTPPPAPTPTPINQSPSTSPDPVYNPPSGNPQYTPYVPPIINHTGVPKLLQGED